VLLAGPPCQHVRPHQALLDRMHRLDLHPLVIFPPPGCYLPRHLPPPPSPHLDLRTGGGPHRNHRLRAQDLLGVLVIPLCIVALVGDDKLHRLVRWLYLLQYPDEVRRVVRRAHPELHSHDQLLPRLHGHRLLEVMPHRTPPTRTSGLPSPPLKRTDIVHARGRGAESSRIDR